MTEIDFLIEKMDTEVEAIGFNLSSGSAKDYPEYQFLCGKIRGLLAAKEIIVALKERMENSDE